MASNQESLGRNHHLATFYDMFDIAGRHVGSNNETASMASQQQQQPSPSPHSLPLDLPPPSYSCVLSSDRKYSLSNLPPTASSAACDNKPAVGYDGPSIITAQPSARSGGNNTSFQRQPPPAVYFVYQDPSVVDPELERCRNTALILSVFSLFCGAWCCAIPAILYAARKPSEASRSHYRTAVILAAVGLFTGLAAIVGIIVANVMVALQMSRIIDDTASAVTTASTSTFLMASTTPH